MPALSRADECANMPPINDQAVVLRLTDYSETSQIVTLFSADHGRLRLIAKGIRRGTRQRFAVGLDLLELGSVAFLPARVAGQLATLTDWVQREPFTALRRELVRLYGALYAAELVDMLTEEGDPHPALFAALVAALRQLAGTGPAAAAVPVFQWELSRAIGYAPRLDACVECGRPFATPGPVYFSATAGGLLCRDCEAPHVEKWQVPWNLVGQHPAQGHPADWFRLFDYHLTHIAGRPARTAAQLAAMLAGQAPRTI